LIPTAGEYHKAGLGGCLWWNEYDYKLFKQSAMEEIREFVQLYPTASCGEILKKYYESLLSSQDDEEHEYSHGYSPNSVAEVSRCLDVFPPRSPPFHTMNKDNKDKQNLVIVETPPPPLVAIMERTDSKHLYDNFPHSCSTATSSLSTDVEEGDFSLSLDSLDSTDETECTYSPRDSLILLHQRTLLPLMTNEGIGTPSFTIDPKSIPPSLSLPVNPVKSTSLDQIFSPVESDSSPPALLPIPQQQEQRHHQQEVETQEEEEDEKNYDDEDEDDDEGNQPGLGGLSGLVPILANAAAMLVLSFVQGASFSST
jgi:hypothetical protein